MHRILFIVSAILIIFCVYQLHVVTRSVHAITNYNLSVTEKFEYIDRVCVYSTEGNNLDLQFSLGNKTEHVYGVKYYTFSPELLFRSGTYNIQVISSSIRDCIVIEQLQPSRAYLLLFSVIIMIASICI